MCNYNTAAVSVYDEGFWYWLAGPILYFGVSLFGLAQLVLHCCRAETVVRHYVSMLSLFLASLILRGAWFMFTCPVGAHPANTTGVNTTTTAASIATSGPAAAAAAGDGFHGSLHFLDLDDAMMGVLTADRDFTVYSAVTKVVSKVSLLLYFTAFTMYVYLWAKVMPFVSVKVMTLVFVVVNIVLWVVCAVLETLAILQSSGVIPQPNGTDVTSLQCGNPLYVTCTPNHTG